MCGVSTLRVYYVEKLINATTTTTITTTTKTKQG